MVRNEKRLPLLTDLVAQYYLNLFQRWQESSRWLCARYEQFSFKLMLQIRTARRYDQMKLGRGRCV